MHLIQQLALAEWVFVKRSIEIDKVINFHQWSRIAPSRPVHVYHYLSFFQQQNPQCLLHYKHTCLVVYLFLQVGGHAICTIAKEK